MAITRNSKPVSREQQELALKFRNLYEQLNRRQKKKVRIKFTQDHETKISTLENKISGHNTVYKSEVDWMERIVENPNEQLRDVVIPERQAA